MTKTRLNLVVAASKNKGIGVNGKIPWNLSKDMAFFKKITTETEDKSKQNAVIMGRKTWLSIPEKYRPLKNRVNIILSNTMLKAPEGVHLAKSLRDAIALTNSEELKSKIESIHVIGGSSVYKEAMDSDYDCRVYLTKIDADFECDTFLPPMDENKFKRVSNPPNISSDVQEEDGLNFTFEVYEKSAP